MIRIAGALFVVIGLLIFIFAPKMVDRSQQNIGARRATRGQRLWSISIFRVVATVFVVAGAFKAFG